VDDVGAVIFVLAVLTSPFKSKNRLEAENAALRHQLIILRRKVRGRVRPTSNDRWFLVQLYRWFPSILQVVTIIQPQTIVRWHPGCAVRPIGPAFAKSGMANVSAEPRAGHCCHGFVRHNRSKLVVGTYAFVIVHLDRRELVWINDKSDGGMVARQLTEAFPWNEAPRYLIRDRDQIYDTVVTRRLRVMGIRDKPIAPAWPWQNG
jgi:hypothetical protein